MYSVSGLDTTIPPSLTEVKPTLFGHVHIGMGINQQVRVQKDLGLNVHWLRLG